MAGITDLSFRIFCRELGAGLVFSEMVSAEALVRDHGRTVGMLRTDPCERPVAVQIFGSRPESMARAARIASSMEVDFIDVNMGCPVPKVIKSGAGAALLRDTALAREIMAAVVKASSVPVTVKIRLGWDVNSIVAFELAEAAEASGVAAVTVHARTRSQGFSGTADWEMIRKIKETARIPVIGNGDVRSATDAKRMLHETGCDGVMIGRACQGNPWIFREAGQYLKTGTHLSPPSPEERKGLILRHLSAMVAMRGENTGVREMRKHLCWYTRGLRGGAEFRTAANALLTADEVVRLLDRYFSSPVFTETPVRA
jgi:tRNA-dihydrouridine synthase B